jgi:hypothetical protein
MNDLGTIAKEVYASTGAYTSYFVPLAFMIRVLWANVSGASSEDYYALFKGLFLYYFLFFTFPYVVDMLTAIPPLLEAQLKEQLALTASSTDIDNSLMPFLIRAPLEAVTIILYHAAKWFNNFVLLAMCSMAPVFFLLSTMFGIGFGVSLFFSFVVISASWPIVWAALEMIIINMRKSTDVDSITLAISEAIINAIKLGGPAGMAWMALQSPAGKATKMATQKAIGSFAPQMSGFSPGGSSNSNSNTASLGKQGSGRGGSGAGKSSHSNSSRVTSAASMASKSQNNSTNKNTNSANSGHSNRSTNSNNSSASNSSQSNANSTRKAASGQNSGSNDDSPPFDNNHPHQTRRAKK